MQIVHQWAVPPDHSSFSGHFPGNPILPGAALLIAIEQCLREQQSGVAIAAISRVKFSATAGPGDDLQIVIDTEESRFQFHVQRGDIVIAQGRGTLRTAIENTR